MSKNDSRSPSVRKKIQLLWDIIRVPALLGEYSSFALAVQTQIGLAKYENQALGIQASSLNTFKRAVNRTIGFDEVERLRLECKRITGVNLDKPKRTIDSRRSLQQKISDLNKVVESQDATILSLVLVVEKIRTVFRYVSIEKLPRPDLFYEKEIAAVNTMLMGINYENRPQKSKASS